MRVRVRETTVVIDLIRDVVDIGELTKLATKLGYIAIVEPGHEEGGARSYQVRFIRDEQFEVYGEAELVNLAVLVAYANGRSGQQVLDQLSYRLKERHYPLDKPIQDVMGIGEGPNHEGHDED